VDGSAALEDDQLFPFQLQAEVVLRRVRHRRQRAVDGNGALGRQVDVLPILVVTLIGRIRRESDPNRTVVLTRLEADGRHRAGNGEGRTALLVSRCKGVTCLKHVGRLPRFDAGFALSDLVGDELTEVQDAISR